MTSVPRARRLLALAAASVLSVALFAATPARAVGSVFYVATTGSNSWAGSQAQPWATVAYGLNHIHAGDTLYVKGGTYRERIGCWVTTGDSACVTLKPDLHNQQGTSSSPVNVVAAPGERPVIWGVLWVKNANYWHFDGLNVTWDATRNTTDDPAVKFLGGIGWSFRNAEVKGAHSYANVFVGTGGSTTQPAGWSLTGNCIHHTYATHPGFLDHNLYLSGSEGTGLVERNIFFYAPAGDNIKVAAGGASSPQPHDVTIRYNTIYYGGQNVRVGHSAKNIRIERNILGKAMGKDWYPNVRGFGVTGSNDTALNNLGYGAHVFLFNDTDSTTGIKNGGGNVFPADPQFDSTSSCSGFHPRSAAAQGYGRYAGTPVVGHWSGAGSDDNPGWAAAGKWRERFSNDSGGPDRTLTFGSSAYKFVAGDWDNDGTASPGLFSNGTWILRDESGSTTTFTFGKAGDRPVVGDWNGDGIDTVGVVRGSTWYLRNLNSGGPVHYSYSYGSSSDVPVAGDWDGNGTDTAGLFRASTATWYLRNANSSSSTSVPSFTYAGSAYRPVVGDWDGDGTDTVGAVLGASWRLRNSNNAGPSDIQLTFDLI